MASKVKVGIQLINGQHIVGEFEGGSGDQRAFSESVAKARFVGANAVSDETDITAKVADRDKFNVVVNTDQIAYYWFI